MDSNLLLSLILFVVGSGIFTAISYIKKYMKESSTTTFNIIYLFTSLLSMFMVILLAPTLMLPGILPFAVSGITGTIYIIVASLSMGLTANFFINMPVSFLIKKLAEANVQLTDLKPNTKHVLYAIALIGMLGLISGASVYAAVQYEQTIHATGQIQAVGFKVYTDAGLTTEVASINWGLRAPGSTITKTVYIQSTSNVETHLQFFVDNWNPAAASSYMTVTTDYNSAPIAPGQVIEVNITLDVSAQISGISNFSHDIHIVAG